MSNAIKRTTSVNAAPRGLDIVSRLIASVLCLYLAVTAPFAYAIDPITGAWTANAAASAAFGGGVTGGAAALEAAVVSAAGAAATAAAAAAAAAAVAGAGVAAYCATSWAIGVNACGSSPAAQATGIPGALAGAGIAVDPQNGNLVKSGATYYTLSGYSVTPGNICFKSDPQSVPNCLKDMVGRLYVNSTITVEPTYIQCTLPSLPSYAICGSIKLIQRRNDQPGASPTPFPGAADIYGYAADSVASDKEVGAAVGANPQARAAAAAATAAPSITAAHAAAAAATAAPRTAEAECAAKGMKHGTFNGTVFCVGVGAGTDGTGAPAGETGTADGAGAGTSNPPATGANPPAGGAAATPLPAFCVYAQTLCNWLLWTKEEPTASGSNKVTIAESTESDVLPNFDIGQQRVVFTANCPPSIPIRISMFGSSVNTSFSHQPLCEFMSNLRPFVIAAAYITGAYIIAGTGRGGGNDG